MEKSWIQIQRHLLGLEAEAESNELASKINFLSGKVCEQEGLSLLNLEVISTSSALFGRCNVELQKIGRHQLPNNFKVGDEVVITGFSEPQEKDKDNETLDIFGLIKRVTSFTVEVIVEEYESRLSESPLRLNLCPSQKTHKKMMDALTILETHTHPLMNLVYDPNYKLPCPLLTKSPLVSQWYSDSLNESQQNAVQSALDSNLISLIHGPPGTGKTSTIIELILQALERNLTILICTPSNIAVDTILTRLSKALDQYALEKKLPSIRNVQELKRKIIRLGHPARISQEILHFTLDAHIASDEGTEIVHDARKELDQLRDKLKPQRGNKRKPNSENKMTFREIKQEIKSIRKEIIQRERKITKEIISQAKIVLGTCVGIQSNVLRIHDDKNDSIQHAMASSFYPQMKSFDLVIIDEAGQGLEAACWIPILHGAKCVLAGDHCQLPPTIKSKEAAELGLNITLFEKLIQLPVCQPVNNLLSIQYRMNDLINSWASVVMYQGKVQSHSSVAHHTLQDLIPISKSENSSDGDSSHLPVLLLVDTSADEYHEDESYTQHQSSHRNVHEAQLILQHASYLLQQGIRPNQIGIITPYRGQVELLREMILTVFPTEQQAFIPEIEIKTIDGFQGGEKECILISLVRSNTHRNVGFLGENRRINVAITRAKRHLAIVCDISTCQTNDFISTLLNHMEMNGDTLTPEEYLTIYPSTITEDLSYKAPVKSLPITKPSGLHTKEPKIKSPSIISTASDFKPNNNNLNAKNNSKQIINDNNNNKIKSKISDSKNNVKSSSNSSSPQDLVLIKLLSFLERYARKDIGNGELLQRRGSQDIAYIRDPNLTCLRFPSSVNSFQRMNLHELATNLNIFHRSVDLAGQRVFEISLIPFPIAEIEESNPPQESDKLIEKDESLFQSANKVQSLHIDDDNSSEEDDDEDDDECEDLPQPPAPDETQLLYPPEPPTKSEGPQLKKIESNKPPPKLKSKEKKKDPRDELDEDALLDLAIQQNRKLAELNKYRFGAHAMPNYDKDMTKDKLKSKLLDAQNSRRSQTLLDEKKEKTSSNNSKQKTVKKPVPNFGGGKLGTK